MATQLGAELSSLDAAFEAFKRIREDYAMRQAAPDEINEAESRWLLIDRILFECLKWPRTAQLELERDGERLDYLLRDEAGSNWVIVEAKRPRVRLAHPEGVGKDGSGTFQLSGPAFKDGAWTILREQANVYAARHGTRLAIVTNGEQWVAAALPPRDGVSLERAKGLVFGDLEAVEGSFERFYNFFSPQGVYQRIAESHLSDGPKWAIQAVSAPYYPPLSRDARGSRHVSAEMHTFHDEIGQALRDSFRADVEDEQMLAKCFVETRHSTEADSRLTRLLGQLSEQLRLLSGQLERRVEGQLDQLRDTAPQAAAARGYLILLTGAPSAGKTTYLQRLFRVQLPHAQRKQLSFVHLRLGQRVMEREGAQDLLGQALASRLELECFGDDGPTAAHLCELYSREWARHRNLFGDGDVSRRDFLQRLEVQRQQAPRNDVVHMLRWLVKSRARLPVIVFDDLDRMPRELQEDVLAWSLQLADVTLNLVLVSLEDTSLWRLQQSEHWSPFHRRVDDSFWLHAPKLGELVRRRFDYMESLFDRSSQGGARADAAQSRHELEL